MCSWHYPAPEEKVNKNTCSWLLRTFAKFAHSPNCSHVGLLSWSSKRGGMPSLRNARVSQREKFMNGTLSLWWWLWWCVFICVLMCVFGIQWSWSSKSAVSPILSLNSFFLRREHHLILLGPDPPDPLCASPLAWSPAGLDAFFVKPCLDVCAWHCTMSGRSLVEPEPGRLRARWEIEEEPWFQRYPVFALHLITVQRLHRGYDVVWCEIVSLSAGLQVCLLLSVCGND